jgi:hypothetical protein
MLVVIPDVHQNIKFANRILIKYDYADRFVFLGDYFDSFLNPPHVASFRETCRTLKYWVKEHSMREKMVFLTGNHDLGYIFNNNKGGRTSTVICPEYYCSGVTKSKISDFRKEFYDQGLKDDFFLNNFKLAHRERGWTFSHAGILPQIMPPFSDIDTFVNELCPASFREFRNFSHGLNYIMSQVGVSRYGNSAVGGILWADWFTDFVPHPAIGKQVCGHTTQFDRPAVMGEGTDCESWCIDSRQRWYATIDKVGKIMIHSLDLLENLE